MRSNKNFKNPITNLSLQISKKVVGRFSVSKPEENASRCERSDSFNIVMFNKSSLTNMEKGRSEKSKPSQRDLAMLQQAISDSYHKKNSKTEGNEKNEEQKVIHEEENTTVHKLLEAQFNSNIVHVTKDKDLRRTWYY